MFRRPVGTAVIVLFGFLLAGQARAQCPVYSLQWDLNGYRPGGIAVDGFGDVYVWDPGISRICEFAGTGELINQWGSLGTADGQFGDVLAGPCIAINAAGDIYVLDRDNRRVQKFTSSGTYLMQWALHDTTTELSHSPSLPFGIAVGPDGSVYVADIGTRHIEKFSAGGDSLTRFGSYGTGDGQFLDPIGLAVDAAGSVYAIDQRFPRVQMFSGDGNYIGQWSTLLPGESPFSIEYHAIAIDHAGNILVTEQYDHVGVLATHRIKKFSNSGSFLCEWGSYGDGDGQFVEPWGVAADAVGDVYVTDLRIQKFIPAPVSTKVVTWGGLKASYR